MMFWMIVLLYKIFIVTRWKRISVGDGGESIDRASRIEFPNNERVRPHSERRDLRSARDLLPHEAGSHPGCVRWIPG